MCLQASSIGTTSNIYGPISVHETALKTYREPQPDEETVGGGLSLAPGHVVACTLRDPAFQSAHGGRQVPTCGKVPSNSRALRRAKSPTRTIGALAPEVTCATAGGTQTCRPTTAHCAAECVSTKVAPRGDTAPGVRSILFSKGHTRRSREAAVRLSVPHRERRPNS